MLINIPKNVNNNIYDLKLTWKKLYYWKLGFPSSANMDSGWLVNILKKILWRKFQNSILPSIVSGLHSRGGECLVPNSRGVGKRPSLWKKRGGNDSLRTPGPPPPPEINLAASHFQLLRLLQSLHITNSWYMYVDKVVYKLDQGYPSVKAADQQLSLGCLQWKSSTVGR